jgi:hypothetical protein
MKSPAGSGLDVAVKKCMVTWRYTSVKSIVYRFVDCATFAGFDIVAACRHHLRHLIFAISHNVRGRATVRFRYARQLVAA